jgi:hypothetical protein
MGSSPPQTSSCRNYVGAGTPSLCPCTPVLMFSHRKFCVRPQRVLRVTPGVSGVTVTASDMCSRAAWLRENAVLGSTSGTGVSRTRHRARRSPSMRRRPSDAQRSSPAAASQEGGRSPQASILRAKEPAGHHPLSRLPIPRHPGPARKASLALRASCDRDAAPKRGKTPEEAWLD